MDWMTLVEWAVIILAVLVAMKAIGAFGKEEDD